MTYFHKSKPSKYQSGIYRSKFEATVVDQLVKAGVKYSYEEYLLEYFNKPYRTACFDCGSTKEIYQTRWYLPDFYLPDVDVYIEAKGYFKPSDRKKMLAVIAAHPDKDIRMLFMNDNWINKDHKMRYSDWCIKHNIQYAFKVIPEEWLR